MNYKWDFVNHTVNFVNPDNPNIHTNRIEGTWNCVKRKLPSSGNYDLESYLPLYIFKQRVKFANKSLFQEFLKIINKHQTLVMNQNKLREKPTKEIIKVKCCFCGLFFDGKVGVKIHQRSCIEKDL